MSNRAIAERLDDLIREAKEAARKPRRDMGDYGGRRSSVRKWCDLGLVLWSG